VWLVDYWISWLELRARGSPVVLADRYIFDLVADPRRVRFGGPEWLARIAIRLAPRPAHVFLCDAPASELYRRKEELPKDVSERQRLGYRRLNLSNVTVVDTTKMLDETVRQVVSVIENRSSG
jgi:thymidylate kinase